MEDLVSIITPAYNAENTIEDTIKSVRRQDYVHWELIIIDDCSNDKTNEIVERYLKLDNRITKITLEKNQGIAIARNIGIEYSKGRYLAFIDSDDLWYSNKLTKQIKFMQENNYAFTYTNYEIIDSQGNKLNKFMKTPKSINFSKLLTQNPIGCLTVVIDTQVVPEIIMPQIIHEDYGTWLSIVKEVGVAYGINENLALYRRSKKSASANKIKSIFGTWELYKGYLKMPKIKAFKYVTLYVFYATIKYVKVLFTVKRK